MVILNVFTFILPNFNVAYHEVGYVEYINYDMDAHEHQPKAYSPKPLVQFGVVWSVFSLHWRHSTGCISSWMNRPFRIEVSCMARLRMMSVCSCVRQWLLCFLFVACCLLHPLLLEVFPRRGVGPCGDTIHATINIDSNRTIKVFW